MRFIDLTAEAIECALQEWVPDDPSQAGIVALLPEAEKDKLPLLQAAVAQRGLMLAGAIFPALIRGDAFITHGAWLLCFDVMPPHFLLPAINSAAEPAAVQVVAATRQALSLSPPIAPDAGKPTLFMLFDSMVPNIASILDDIYLALANRVEYGGVNAGSETFQPMPCLFDGTRVVGDGMLGLLLPPSLSPLLEHGFMRPERSMGATATDGNRIATIDWRPAFDVYQEIIKAEFGIELTRENFYQYGVHYPFGILRANGDVVVRIPVGLAEDGSVFCVGEIPENAMLVLLQAPLAGANDCMSHLAKNLQAAHGSLVGRDLLAFSCAGRRMHLGEAAAAELASLIHATGVSTLGGALSLGEIGSTTRGGYPMFHNATIVSTPWSPQ